VLTHWPIRIKLLLGTGLLLLTVGVLAFSGFQGVYSYRRLAKSTSHRAAELPLATALAQRVSDLRVTFAKARQIYEFPSPTGYPTVRRLELQSRYLETAYEVERALNRYRAQLEGSGQEHRRIGNNEKERATVAQIERTLDSISKLNNEQIWDNPAGVLDRLDGHIERLHDLSAELPSYLQQRFHALAGDVRLRYRTWIVLAWATTALAIVMLGVYVRLFYAWVFRPLRILIRGSRRVAGGEFDHRIELNTSDEMAELASAMNNMTQSFRDVRDDLDRQVKERTKEVVQSEQLASVGFLAAGVAHEINNPLASIAMCAESLEDRIREILQTADATCEAGDSELPQENEVVQSYLRMIQEEAFRCKEITEQLLDFSRMGESEKHDTDLAELVRGVIDMVGHLGHYKEKVIDFTCEEPVIAPVNPQEIKQVVLNLITNALDSLESGGSVRVELRKAGRRAELLVTDNGCGMSDEVREHLFEPFFTRRRDGRGTGLGLSITYRIVADHGGRISAVSDGPGHGSQFSVTLPLIANDKESSHRYQAA